MAADFYFAKPGPITPIGLPGHRIALYVNDGWLLYQIRFVDKLSPSHPIVFDLGAVTAGAVSVVTALTNLELYEEIPELVQLRSYVLDDVEMQISRGVADILLKTKLITTRISRATRQIDPCGHITEIMVLKGDEPNVQAINLTNYDLSQARIAFYGFKYRLQSLNQGKVVSTMEQLERMGPLTIVSLGGD